MAKEFDGTIDVPGASLRPQAPQIWRGRGPILIRQGELKGGRRKKKMCGRGLKMSYPVKGAQGGKGKKNLAAGCHRGMLGTGTSRKRSGASTISKQPDDGGEQQRGGGGRGPPGAQDPLSALRLNNQPVPSNSAEPVAYRGAGRSRK